MSLYSFLPSPFRRYNSNEESFFAFVKRRPTRVGRVIKEKFGGEKKLVKFLWSQKLLSHSHSCLIHSTGKEFSLVFSFICILLLSSCIFCVFQYLLSLFLTRLLYLLCTLSGSSSVEVFNGLFNFPSSVSLILCSVLPSSLDPLFLQLQLLGLKTSLSPLPFIISRSLLGLFLASASGSFL